MKQPDLPALPEEIKDALLTAGAHQYPRLANQLEAYVRAYGEAVREACAVTCDAQAAIYDAKADQAMNANMDERCERFQGYHEVAEWIASLIRAERE